MAAAVDRVYTARAEQAESPMAETLYRSAASYASDGRPFRYPA